MKPTLPPLALLLLSLLQSLNSFCWGFYGHQKINYIAVFLLPPEMLFFYKPRIQFISEHAVDPDKRRYAVPGEGFKHYIDLDLYGPYPYDSLPRKWTEAVAKYGEDSLLSRGIVPWQVQFMLSRLTRAFREKNYGQVLICSAELGHYVADAHVPLHTNSNHNGQFSNQKGIHAFWESRVPELLAEKNNLSDGFDFIIGKAQYLRNPGDFIWKRVLESAKAADSVLQFEKILSQQFPGDRKYAFEERNMGTIPKLIRQYSTGFTIAYDKMLNGMVERRMRQSIQSIASLWFTAWVNAGQPGLKELEQTHFTAEDINLFNMMDEGWKKGNTMIGRTE
ncbi:MAG: zinc dependent phospholipase C family protein [Chitinophagaceae bacterium]|nr:zinc dependent phospholipase C family protein [Chitinophagaceae bacterium]